jgi:hypothetical protein
MNENEDFLLFLLEAISCLQEANEILAAAKTTPIDNPIIRRAVVERAIIEYAKPFMQSEGVLKRHKGLEKIIPLDCIKNHERIMFVRNKCLAHADIKHKEPLLQLREYKGSKVRTVSSIYFNAVVEVGGVDFFISHIGKIVPCLHEESAGIENSLRTNL